MSNKAANKRRYGWQPNPAHRRDHLDTAHLVPLAKLPTKAGLVIIGQSAWWLERSFV
jgi:hypothetical protein